MMSMPSISSSRRRARSMSWAADILMPASLPLHALFCILPRVAAERTSCSRDVTLPALIGALVCARDQTVILTAIESVQVYPDALRRVTYFDLENERRLKFLTNNFALPALTIAKIYKSRRMVDLFFQI